MSEDQVQPTQEQEQKQEQPETVDIPSSVPATKQDTDALLDAVKELTKVVGEISNQWEKWRKAGKF